MHNGTYNGTDAEPIGTDAVKHHEAFGSADPDGVLTSTSAAY